MQGPRPSAQGHARTRCRSLRLLGDPPATANTPRSLGVVRCRLAHVSSRRPVRARKRGSGTRPWSLLLLLDVRCSGPIRRLQSLGLIELDHLFARLTGKGGRPIVTRAAIRFPRGARIVPDHSRYLTGEAVRAGRTGTQIWHNDRRARQRHPRFERPDAVLAISVRQSRPPNREPT